MDNNIYKPSGKNYKLKDLREKSIEELNKKYLELVRVSEDQVKTTVNKVVLAEKYKRVMLEKGCLPNIGGAVSVVEFKQDDGYVTILSYKVAIGKIKAIDLYELYLKSKQ